MFGVYFSNAVKTLKASPGYSAIILLTLVLTITVIGSVASIANTLLFRALPYPDEDKLVVLYQQIETEQDTSNNAQTLPVQEHWYQQNPNIESMALVYQGSEMVSSLANEPRFDTLFITPEYFALLDTPFVKGRGFELVDGFSSQKEQAVISETLWQQHFGGAQDILSQTLTIKGRLYNIIGVVSNDFNIPHALSGSVGDIWLPWTAAEHHQAPRERVWMNSFNNLVTLAKLKPGQTLEQIKAPLDKLAEDLRNEWQPLRGFDKLSSHPVMFRQAELGGQSTLGISVLLIGLALVLIALVNISNMFASRVVTRAKTFAIQSVVGAKGRNIFLGVLMENLILWGIAIVAGLALTFAALAFFQSIVAGVLPQSDAMTVNWVVIAVTIVVAGILAAGLSYLAYRRLDPRSLGASLTSGGKGVAVQMSRTKAKTLVGLQIALASMVLIFSGLSLLKAYDKVNMDTGIDVDGMHSLIVTTSNRAMGNNEKRDLLAQVRENIAQMDKVDYVATGTPPMSPGSAAAFMRGDGSSTPQIGNLFVSADYFDKLGIELIEGRTFSEAAVMGEAHEMIVSESAAKLMAQSGPVLGQFFKGFPSSYFNKNYEVVGVTQDIYHPLDKTRSQGARIWLPMRPQWSPTIVKAKTGQQVSRAELFDTVKATANHLHVFRHNDLTKMFDGFVYAERVIVATTAFLSLFTLLIAAMGLYGVITMSLGARSVELGVKIALGAPKKSFYLILFNDFIVPALIGVAIAAVFVVGGYWLFGLDAWFELDWPVMLLVLLSVTLISWLLSFASLFKVFFKLPQRLLRAE